MPLPGGGLLTVRPVTRADVDGLMALYDGLSRGDRYRRFFSAYSPPRAFFERLATVVERGGYGVVATAGADNEAVEHGGTAGQTLLAATRAASWGRRTTSCSATATASSA